MNRQPTPAMWHQLVHLLNLRVANEQLTLDGALAVWERAEHLGAGELLLLIADLEVGE